ncbi:hypothetical protein BG011_007089 [Mortierella polycephala]|uniref:MARVEL domain-containing protein n=1 Tax=Mortierella polycephala TaxID=41804 RepID=A0A9P6PTM2_9FUNG|nr:hypothetical protein BG011_007089 [Mortierella polycephala]
MSHHGASSVPSSTSGHSSPSSRKQIIAPLSPENTATQEGIAHDTSLAGLSSLSVDPSGSQGINDDNNDEHGKSAQPPQAAAAALSTAENADGHLATSTANSDPPTASPKSKPVGRQQTLLTKVLLSYLNFFRIVQPLASLGVFATITPILHYFRTQTMFPAIQATLYTFAAILACCSLFFSVIYFIDVFYRKPLFWPFTNRHFRQTSKARIGGDLIVCMVFCGLWFLSLVGLVIDTVWVDCSRLDGLERVFSENHHSFTEVKIICRLEKATLALAIVCWACWVGVLLVLLYGHFWKRRQVIAERLRSRLAKKSRSSRTTGAAGASSAIPPEGASQAGMVVSGRNGAGVGGSSENGSLHEYGHTTRSHQQESRAYGCQNMEGEVGLTGIICRYDDERSTLGHSTRRGDYSQADSAA